MSSKQKRKMKRKVKKNNAAREAISCIGCLAFFFIGFILLAIPTLLAFRFPFLFWIAIIIEIIYLILVLFNKVDLPVDPDSYMGDPG